MTIDLDQLERIVKAGDRYGHNTPAVTLELIAEVRRLQEENMLCRNAIEDAVDMVDVCAEANDDDHSQGALRATKRLLSEAICKACPRLLMERPEGQKLYGLHWRELREENEALRADAERYRWAISLEDNVEQLYAAVISCGPDMPGSINIEIDAHRAKDQP